MKMNPKPSSWVPLDVAGHEVLPGAHGREVGRVNKLQDTIH